MSGAELAVCGGRAELASGQVWVRLTPGAVPPSHHCQRFAGSLLAADLDRGKAIERLALSFSGQASAAVVVLRQCEGGLMGGSARAMVGLHRAEG